MITGGEECDGSEFGGLTCDTVPGHTFDSGSLACDPVSCLRDLGSCGVCGNGAIDGDETCDDGNANAEDGCSATCTVEDGFRCVPDGSATFATRCFLDFSFVPIGLDPSAVAPNSALAVTCSTTLTSAPGAAVVSEPACVEGLDVARVFDPGDGSVGLAVTAFSIAPAVTLTLAGDRAITFLVFGDASIQGTIDVGANGDAGGPGARTRLQCGSADGTAGADDTSGGGGGGGGGHVGAGAAGGSGSSGGNGNAAGGDTSIASSALRLGGCPGGRGGEGDGGGAAGAGGGGGAVQLAVAGQAIVVGTIAAPGDGGRGGPASDDGGGGGGSGGLVVVEAGSLVVSGAVTVNGGGGGAGSDGGAQQAGARGSLTLGARASGGASTNAGNGGLGEAQEGGATAGANNNEGAGGGGGGVGRIILHGGACDLTGAMLSPSVACGPPQ